MNPRGILFLGWNHLGKERGRVALLVAAMTLSLFLPMAVSVGVDAVERHSRARSAATPLLLGAPGSAQELVFNALYFNQPAVPVFPVGIARQIARDTGSLVIPVHARFQARDRPVVGTSLDYFGFRGLVLERGQWMGRIGDCVLGAEVAAGLALGPGDRIASTPEQLFDLAGVYPLRMRVTGVLRPSGTADDRAVFCDVKTAWIIEGIAHGHEDARRQEPGAVLEETGANVALNASIREFQEVTPENIGSFHFHGDADAFPLTAAIVVPPDAKTETILLGRHRAGTNAATWMVRPGTTMDGLFDTVFRVRDLVVGALALVGGCAVAITALVFALSNRLRTEEFRSLANLGAPRATVRWLVAFEAVFVGLTSLALGILGTVILRVLVPVLLARFAG